ncbi:drug resistance transporter, EmrB/QacA family [Paenibacillus sp. JCM 10914]|nr:drug resistance transporter, EmrB/QacA family [Paenibacillus sp. JCM 10914]
MPMMLGSVFGSQGGGMLTTRTSFRNIMIVSVICFIAGIACLSTISPETPRYLLTIYMVLTGFGVGFSFSVLSMASIHNFDARQRGAATSTNSFLRSFGMTVGITIFGIIQRNSLNNQLSELTGGGKAPVGDQLNADAVLSPEVMNQIPPNVREQITNALADSIATTFMWALVPAVLAWYSY